MGTPVPVEDLPDSAPDSSKVVPGSDLPDGYSAPQASSGPPYLLHPDPNVSRESDRPLESPTEQAVGAYNRYAGNQLVSEGKLLSLGHLRDPRSIQDLRNAPAAAETVLGLAAGRGSPANRPFGEGPQWRPFGLGQTEAPVPHPLQGIADAERAEMQTHAQALESAGVDLPPRELTPQQQWVNRQAGTDLKLPENAPVTDAMIDAGKKLYASPANEAVKAVGTYRLGPKYEAAMKGIDLSKIDPEWRPMPNGMMDGQSAFELSAQLRSTARGLYDDAENMNLTYAQRTEARQAAQAHYQAAKAVEAGFREGTGQTEIADNWDAARVYTAKAEAWRGAIDQAGNVSGPKIKRLLGDEPITGPMKSVASAVAQYPEMFRSTRLQTPAPPGLVRSVTAKAAPVVGGVIGAVSPLGPIWGTAAGATLGERFANRLLKKP